MPALAPAPPATVLVTAASSFTGVHTATALLARGFRVRGTVRAAAKGAYLQQLLADERFAYVVVPDVALPGAFDEAVLGVDAVAHLASPLWLPGEDNPPEMWIKPALNGTLELLNALQRLNPTVRRVVHLSSAATMLQPEPGPYALSEADWNTACLSEFESLGASAAPFTKYSASKVLAERALWDFVARPDVAFDAVALNPPFIYGPVLQETGASLTFADLNYSTVVLLKHLQAATEADWTASAGTAVDVRDIAAAIVDALERADLAGHRLAFGIGPLATQDLLDAAHSLPAGALPALPFAIPAGAPGCADAARATFRRLAPTGQALLGRPLVPLADTIKDTLWSLHARGLL